MNTEIDIQAAATAAAADLEIQAAGWRLMEYDNGLLRGSHGYSWPDAEVTAEHRSRDYKGTGDPVSVRPQDMEDGCESCGIYMLDTQALALDQGTYNLWGGQKYIVEVEGWGIAIEGERGWRTEHARITRIQRVPEVGSMVLTDQPVLTATAINQILQIQASYRVPVEQLGLGDIRAIFGQPRD